ncbi:MAG: type II secretion system F family protein, partial [Planctomycetota bacterium]
MSAPPAMPIETRTDSRTEPRASFAYRVREGDGRESTGVVAAASAQEVARRLRAEGKTVLSVARDEAVAAKGRVDAPSRSTRARRSDLAGLCRHLGTMTEAGVPLADALAAASRESARPEFRPFVEALAADVEAGVPLSQAFSRRGRDIPAIVVALTRAAESTGQLGPMLLRASDHLRRSERTVHQLRAAASYPMFMLGAGSLVVLALLVFVLPRFAKIYAERGAELPFATKLLLAASEAVRGHALELGIGLALAGAASWAFVRSDAGRLAFDRIRFGAPVVGRIARTAFVAVACRTLATLLAAGIPLLDAIAICRGLVRSARAEAFWTGLDAKLRDG